MVAHCPCRIVTALLLASCGPVFAGNFAECLLDRLPGTANQPTHGAVFQVCTKDHPGRYSDIEKGSGRGVFGYADGNACTIQKARSTPYELSSMQIAFACRCLYDAPRQQGELCDGRIRFANGEVFDPSSAIPQR